MTINHQFLARLSDAVACLIETAEDAFSEYELIQRLNQQGWTFSTRATESLALFQSHFLVYHTLYRLQSEYWARGDGLLQISALEISLLKISNEDTDSSVITTYQGDKSLREYYLDLANLDSMTEDAVNQLLNQFWSRFVQQEDEARALDLLGLAVPFNKTELKQRYRQLAMEHHPDRGGNKLKFQELNWAFGVLQNLVFQ